MLKAFHIMWWNKKDGRENQELDVMIITDSVDKVFVIFKKEFPDHDPNLIQNIEILPASVVVG